MSISLPVGLQVIKTQQIESDQANSLLPLFALLLQQSLCFGGRAHDNRVATGGHALPTDGADEHVVFGRLVPGLHAFFLGVGGLIVLGRGGLSGGGRGGGGRHVRC